MRVLRRIHDAARWLAHRHTLLLVAALSIVLGTWAFIAILDSVREGQSRRFDDRVIQWCWRHKGPPWLQDSGRDLTALGGVTVLSLVVIAVVNFLLILRKRGAAALVVVATAAAVGEARSRGERREPTRGAPVTDGRSAGLLLGSLHWGWCVNRRQCLWQTCLLESQSQAGQCAAMCWLQVLRHTSRSALAILIM